MEAHLGLPPAALLARLLRAHARVLRRGLVDDRRGVERARHRPRRRRRRHRSLHGTVFCIGTCSSYIVIIVVYLVCMSSFQRLMLKHEPQSMEYS